MLISIKAPESFKASVRIPLPGGVESDPFEVTFKHRTKTELKKFMAAAAKDGATELETVMGCLEGWGLSDAFNRENVATFLEEYHAAAGALLDAYWKGLAGVRSGN